jgi:hypothetical protein
MGPIGLYVDVVRLPIDFYLCCVQLSLSHDTADDLSPFQSVTVGLLPMDIFGASGLYI